jgi:hypothetical protein
MPKDATKKKSKASKTSPIDKPTSAPSSTTETALSTSAVAAGASEGGKKSKKDKKDKKGKKGDDKAAVVETAGVVGEPMVVDAELDDLFKTTVRFLLSRSCSCLTRPSQHDKKLITYLTWSFDCLASGRSQYPPSRSSPLDLLLVFNQSLSSSCCPRPPTSPPTIPSNCPSQERFQLSPRKLRRSRFRSRRRPRRKRRPLRARV